MRFLLLSLLLILPSCRDRTRLIVVPPCEPREETCNGLDDDCDGEVDDVPSHLCSSECATGRTYCKKGAWTECDARKPTPEVCDGNDNNCDGRIDEEEVIGVAPCYPGPNTDLLHGECRWGVKRCLAGAFVCQGYVSPMNELCDGKDNDCDGQVDEGTAGGLDLIICVDFSGSMSGNIAQLSQVTSQWAQKYAGRNDLKMGLCGIPSDNIGQDSLVTLMKDLTTPGQFATELALHQVASGGGNEPSIDAVYQLAQTSNPLNVHWTSGNRRAVVIYTDEIPQSYLSPSVTEQQARQLAASIGLRVFVFTSDPSWYNWSPRPFSASTTLESNLDDVVQQGSCR